MGEGFRSKFEEEEEIVRRWKEEWRMKREKEKEVGEKEKEVGEKEKEVGEKEKEVGEKEKEVGEKDASHKEKKSARPTPYLKPNQLSVSTGSHERERGTRWWRDTKCGKEKRRRKMWERVLWKKKVWGG
jgi:hypothetical protein